MELQKREELQAGDILDEHKKKMIGPVIITVLVVIYYLIYFGILISLVKGGLKILLGLIPLAVMLAMVYVCIQRIDEIRSGEEDDLSKY